MTSTTVWRAVADALVAEGVGRVFGLPGNPKHLLFDLTEHTDIPFVLVRDEKSAVAYAHVRLTRRPGIVFSNPAQASLRWSPVSWRPRRARFR